MSATIPAAMELPQIDARVVERRVLRARWREPRAFMEFSPSYRGASWDRWREIVGRVTDAVRELYVVAGRGSGKSRIAAMIAACFASRDYRRVPGERIYVGVFAPDRKQAKVTFSYVLGLLRSVPELATMIEREVRESVDLTNGITIEVMTASKTSARSRAYALAIVEEAAFLPQDESAEPDVELVRALRPALARVPGSLLVVISSPYARRGVLWQAWDKNAKEAEARAKDPGLPTDPSVLVVHESTLSLNPTFDRGAIAKAREEDPIAAATEYDATFRADIESFVTREAVEACQVRGRYELAPRGATRYVAFVDPSGGRVDSMTMAIGHVEDKRLVGDLLVERKAPFSPEAVVADFADTLRRYRIDEVQGDRYGGEWPAEMFSKKGVAYKPCDRAKSELYRDALPLLNSGRLELLESPRLVEQLVGLERRTARGGRDSVDHAPNGHDDVANAMCGLAAMLVVETEASGGMLW